MRRRDILAGVGSLGVLGGSGWLFWRGLNSFAPDTTDDTADGDRGDPREVETVDAPGSEAGTISIPGGSVTAAMFFATSCGNCQAQVSRLAEARAQLDDEYGDAVRVLGASLDSEEMTPPDELADWWATHGGDGPVGYSSGLGSTYGTIGYPTTIVIDSSGEKRWSETDILSARAIVRAVEGVLEDEGLDGESAADGTEPTTDGSEDGGGNETAD